MQHTTKHAAGALALLLTLSMGAPLAFAQGEATTAEDAAKTSEFDGLIDQANAAYAEREYGRAVQLFEKAYALDPQPNIIYNIARIEERAGRIDVAIDRYDEFLGKGEVDQEFRRDALDRRKLLGEVVEVRDKKAKEEAEALAKKNAPVEAPPTPEAPEDEPSLVGPIVLIGVGLAGFGTSGVLAMQTNARYETYADTAATVEAREQARDEGSTLALASDVTLGVGALSTLIGVIWLATSGGDSDKTKSSSRIEPVIGERTGVVWTLDF